MSDSFGPAKQTRANLVRILGGMTLIGTRLDDPKVQVTPQELREAVEKISGRPYAEVRKTVGRNGDEPTPREMLEAACALRWGCKPATVRAFDSGRRRPTRKQRPFRDDLKQYGAARFGRNGAVVKDSLGRGMDFETFLDVTEPGSDRR